MRATRSPKLAAQRLLALAPETFEVAPGRLLIVKTPSGTFGYSPKPWWAILGLLIYHLRLLGYTYSDLKAQMYLLFPKDRDGFILVPDRGWYSQEISSLLRETGENPKLIS